MTLFAPDPLTEGTGVCHYNRVLKGKPLGSLYYQLSSGFVGTKQMTNVEQALQLLEADDVTPADTLEVVKELVDKLHYFHAFVIEKRGKEGEDLSPQWLVDLQTLTYVIKMLETIEF